MRDYGRRSECGRMEDIMVKAKKLEVIQKRISVAMVFIVAFYAVSRPVSGPAAGGLELSTDYPGMSVKPGDNSQLPIT